MAGRRDVVNRMMSNVRQNLRYSGLCELLKENLPPEQMAAVNQANRAKICRRLLIEYFDAGDYFVTYTYKVEQRPKDMTVALKDLQKALRKLRPKYKKANTPFYWIRNIERGTKSA